MKRSRAEEARFAAAETPSEFFALIEGRRDRNPGWERRRQLRILSDQVLANARRHRRCAACHAPLPMTRTIFCCTTCTYTYYRDYRAARYRTPPQPCQPSSA